jgi:hypothetical protein
VRRERRKDELTDETLVLAELPLLEGLNSIFPPLLPWLPRLPRLAHYLVSKTMPSLSDIDKARCRDHLGYAAPESIPVGDAARLEEQMNKLPNDYQVNQIRYFIDRCDRALINSDQSDLGSYSQKQLITGDINRTTLTQTNRDSRVDYENYLLETDRLAYRLNVANYQRPEQGRYRWERFGMEYVQALPGVADTCTGDRLQLSESYV